MAKRGTDLCRKNLQVGRLKVGIKSKEEVFEYLKTDPHGLMQSSREMAEKLRVSKSSIDRHLKSLHDDGRIKWTVETTRFAGVWKTTRTIKIIDPNAIPESQVSFEGSSRSRSQAPISSDEYAEDVQRGGGLYTGPRWNVSTD